MNHPASAPPKSRRWWLLAVALLAVSFAGFAQFMNFSLRGQPADSAADRGDKRFVVCLGHVDFESGVTRMRAMQPGRVSEVLVHEGDTVSANTALLRMNDDLPKAQAQQARIELDSAKADLEDARVKLPAKHRLDLQNAGLAVTLARYNRDARDNVYQYKKKALETKGGIASPTDVDLAKKEWESAEAELKVAENNLQQLQLREPQTEIRRLEAQVAKLSALVGSPGTELEFAL